MICSWLQITPTSLHPRRWESYSNCQGMLFNRNSHIVWYSRHFKSFFYLNRVEQNPLERPWSWSHVAILSIWWIITYCCYITCDIVKDLVFFASTQTQLSVIFIRDCRFTEIAQIQRLWLTCRPRYVLYLVSFYLSSELSDSCQHWPSKAKDMHSSITVVALWSALPVVSLAASSTRKSILFLHFRSRFS